MVDPQGGFSALRPQSARVLDYLAARAGEVVTRDEIFAEVWPDTAVTDDSLTQCIGDIRRALGDSGRRVLETIPRRGFRLHADRAAARPLSVRMATVAGLGAAALVLVGALWRGDTPGEHVPTVSIVAGEGTEALAAEVGAALDRYGSVRRMSDGARFVLALSRPSATRISAELTDRETAAIVLSQALAASDAEEPVEIAGSRLANSLASPSSGAIARELMRKARQKPLQMLTPYECYLHYHQSGSEEIFRRAGACLSRLVEEDPGNARALALLGGVYVTQYWYGRGLDGPARDDRGLRVDLADRALAAVRAAEAAVLPADAAIHLAVAKAYYGSCMKGRMAAALDRAIELNPHDPAILGTAGNYLAYVGEWEEGAALARRAIGFAQHDYERWWFWPIGKDAWLRGDYEAALDAFTRGYMADDWHTHLHLAYTLPFLGRLDEARDEVERLRRVYPGFTRADARETHRRWCFDAAFITRMDDALARAGLPDGPDGGLTALRQEPGD